MKGSKFDQINDEEKQKRERQLKVLCKSMYGFMGKKEMIYDPYTDPFEKK